MKAAALGERVRPLVRRLFVCILLLGTPLFVTGVNSSQVYVQSAFAVAVISVLLLVEVPSLLRSRTLRVPSIYGWLLALVAAALLSLFASRDLLTSLKALLPMVLFIAYAFILTNSVADRRELHLYLGCIAFTLAVTGAYGLAQYIGLVPGSPSAPSGAAAVLSTFGQRAFLAAFSAPAVVLALGLALSAHAHVATRIGAGLACLVGVVTLTAIVQRGALLALFVGLATLFLLWVKTARAHASSVRDPAVVPRPRRMAIWAILVFVVLGAAGFAYVSWSRVASWRPPGGPFHPAVGRWVAGSPAAVALFDIPSGTFYFEDRTTFRANHATALPVAGDWNGDGADDLGIYDQRSGQFTLYLGDRTNPIERVVQFGTPGARVTPVAGDWNGDGVFGIGLFDPADATWRLRETPTEGPSDRALAFGTGQAHCDAIVGDWDGSGQTRLGVYDYYTKRFELLTEWPRAGAPREQRTIPANYVGDGDIPIAGAFADSPAAGVGVFRASSLRLAIDRFGAGKADFAQAWGRGSWSDFVQSRTMRLSNYTTNLRLANWLIAADMLFDHPLLGIGLANYKLRFTDYQAKFLSRPSGRPFLDQAFPRAEQAHNDYIQWVAETGLLGSALMLTTLLVFLFTALQGTAPAVSADRTVRLALVAGVVTILADALVLFPFHLPATALLTATAVGLLYAPALRSDPRVVRCSPRVALLGTLLVFPFVLVVLYSCGRDFVADRFFVLGRRALLFRENETGKDFFYRSWSLGLPAPGQVSYHLGVVAESENDLRFAAAYFAEARRRLPSPVAYVKDARYAVLRGEYAATREHIAVLNRLLRPQDPLSIETRLVEATLEIAAGRPAVAESILRRLLQEMPDSVSARVALAYLQESLNRRIDAVQQLRFALPMVTRQLIEQRFALDALRQRETAPAAEVADAIARLEQLERARQEIRSALRSMNADAGPEPSATSSRGNGGAAPSPTE